MFLSNGIFLTNLNDSPACKIMEMYVFETIYHDLLSCTISGDYLMSFVGLMPEINRLKLNIEINEI